MGEVYNFIDKNGTCNTDWITYLAVSREGFSCVERTDKKQNFINKKGRFLSTEWFKSTAPFSGGFAKVQRCEDKLYNLIKTDGTYLCDEWFKSVSYFKEEGIARVQRSNDKWYFLNKRGVDIIDQGFMYADDLKTGLPRFIQEKTKKYTNWIRKVFFIHIKEYRANNGRI